MYSTTEVAKLLDIKFYRILYAHKAGHIDEPERIAGNRAYTKQEVFKLADHFCINYNEVLERMNQVENANAERS